MRRMKIMLATVMAAILAMLPLSVASADETGQYDTYEEGADESAIEVSESEPIVISLPEGISARVGGEVALQASGAVVSWSLENADPLDLDEHAILSGSGVLTGISTGLVRVIAVGEGGAQGSLEIEIKPARVEVRDVSLGVYDVRRLSAFAEDFPNAVFTWSLENTVGGDDAVYATITSDGVITCIAPGSVIVTAETQINGEAAFGSRVLTVADSGTIQIGGMKPEVTLSLDSEFLRAGESAQATAAVTGIDDGYTLAWQCEGAATVDETGRVTGTGEGKATLTATVTKSGYTVKSSFTFSVYGSGVAIRVDDTTLAAGQGTSARASLAGAESFVWESADTSVVTVTPEGEISSVAPGRARVIATAMIDGIPYSGSVEIVVYQPKLQINSVSNVRKGETLALEAGISGLAQGEFSLSWRATGASAAFTVDEDGNLTALAAGSGVVFAYAVSPCFSGTLTAATLITVTEQQQVGISIRGGGVVYSGVPLPLSVAPVPADATVKIGEVEWSVSNEDIATIDRDGLLTAVTVDGLCVGGGKATVTVTAKANGYETTSLITIRQSALSVAPAADGNVTVFVGQNRLLAVTQSPVTAGSPVTWSSDRPDIAMVDETGLVLGVATGEAVITALCNGKTVSFTCTVKKPAETVEILAPASEIGVGGELILTSRVLPADAEDPVVTWSSSAPCITVENGRLLGVSKGVATITGTTAGGKRGSVEINCVQYASSFVFYGSLASLSLVIGVGQTVAVPVSVLPAGTSDQTFTSASASAATASTDGANRITGVQTGDTVITLTSGDGKASVRVPVRVVDKGRSVTQVRLSYASGWLYEGDVFTLKANVMDFAVAEQDAVIRWYSGDEEICTISDSGTITGIKAGVCKVYALSTSGVRAECVVTVKPTLPTDVSIVPDQITIMVDEREQLIYRVLPTSIGTPGNRALTWETSNPSVAIVSNTGEVYGMGVGTCYLRATTVNGKTGLCKVTVLSVPVEAVHAWGQSDLLRGASYQFSCGVSPSNATKSTVLWTSGDDSIAVVDSKTGKVTAVSNGTTYITCRAIDGSGASASVRVTVKTAALESFAVSLVRSDTGKVFSVAKADTITLPYGTDGYVKAAVVPALDLSYASGNPRVATVSASGVFKTTGAGETVITVSAGGLYAYSFTLRVTTENTATYRALVVGQYGDADATGYLTFSNNCVTGIGDALDGSRIDGASYDVTTYMNVAGKTQFLAAMATLADTAKSGDVTMIYLLSHGLVVNGTYRWYIDGGSNAKGTNYVTAKEIMSAVGKVRGHVVLVMCSCYSGGIATDSATGGVFRPLSHGSDAEDANQALIALAMASDNQAPAGSSLSVICSAGNNTKSSYQKTVESKSYDFFSYTVSRALGWNLLLDIRTPLAADLDGDGYVTVTELASYSKAKMASEIAEYLETFGISSFNGNAQQTVNYYISSSAKDLKLYGLH